MRRFEERKQDLLNATERLKEALKQEENDIVIDCVLHRFEFTFELAWKTMKDFLEYNGISENIEWPAASSNISFYAADNFVAISSYQISLVIAACSKSQTGSY